MTLLIALFAVFAVLFGIYVFVVLPIRGWRAAVGTLLFLLLSASTFAVGFAAIGLPRPMFVWDRLILDEARIISALPVEDQAIYLWLEVPGKSEPIVYSIPWSIEAAKSLQQAMREGESTGSGAVMTFESEGGLDDQDPKFYAMPQPANPPKSPD